MDIDRARTFLEIARLGSFLKAAERLNVSQTAVSARIRTLEEELGRPLFVRNRNGARLTAAGIEFERYARTFVQVWERARQSLALPEGKSGIVGIGAELSLWSPLLADWMAALKAEAPELAIHAHVGAPAKLVEDISSGALDIAILYAPQLAPGFVVERVLDDQLVQVAPGAAAPVGASSTEAIFVDWGPAFPLLHGQARFHAAAGTVVDFGPLGLAHLLGTGGRGYFRRSMVAPLIAEGRLAVVPESPAFPYPAYAVRAEEPEERREVAVALAILGKVLAIGR
ncbi:HTH-type transcriptional regulator YofA [Rhizobiaceae bacterium]|nr:HTH-type transcriptional regulator YofA [Rhizobiaceae bacterium]